MIRSFFWIFFLFLFTTLATLQASFALHLPEFKSHKRSYLYIVGSSTVSPLMAAVAEEFGRNQNLKNAKAEVPVVESNGTKEGFKLFCAGTGYKYPDFADASRPIDKSEIDICHKNGIKNIVEIKIGYDGIVLANAAGSKKFKLSEEQIFLALAEKIPDPKTGNLIGNPYVKWSQIDKSLPEQEIVIYGPPLTSGTRDVFLDFLTEDVCFAKKEFIAAFPDVVLRRAQCHTIRKDGKFIESGENDNLIVQKLKENRNAFGIVGFDFLTVNHKIIQAVKIDNVEPNFNNISTKKYKLSRPLFVYFKKEHLKLMPEMREFIQEIISIDTLGKKGYLVRSGLVVLSDSELDQIRKEVLSQLN